MIKWDPTDIKVIAFFNKFPVKRKVDEEIRAVPDLDLLYFSILTFVFSKYQRRFIEVVVHAEVRDRHYAADYEDFCSIPHAFFKGYFHDWAIPCTDSIRLGNPKDPMYGYSYETPAMRNLKFEKAFELGAIPCSKCFWWELRFIRDEIESATRE